MGTILPEDDLPEDVPPAARHGSRDRLPLPGQDREVELGAPLPPEPLVLHQAGLQPHAEAADQPDRGLVALVDPGDDAVQAEALEAEAEQGVQGLGGVAPAAQVRVEDAADLAARV